MKKVKQTAEYGVYAKRSGRYAIKGRNKQWLHGDEKAAVLKAEGLIKAPPPRPVVEEALAGEAAADATPADDEAPAADAG